MTTALLKDAALKAVKDATEHSWRKCNQHFARSVAVWFPPSSLSMSM